MSEPFIAEIRIFAGNFAPRNWAFCNGQLLPIAQNTALFSLVGTIYGGDGRSTFGLPNLQGRAPMHAGSGPGLTPRNLGESGGTETETLSAAQLPNHSHVMQASSNTADLSAPATARSLARSSGGFAYQQSNAGLVDLAPEALPSVGGGQPHNNRQPYLALNFIIALAGFYPSRD